MSNKYEHLRVISPYTVPVSGVDDLPVVLTVGEVIDDHPRLTTTNKNSLIDLGIAEFKPSETNVNITHSEDVQYYIGDICNFQGSQYAANKDSKGTFDSSDWDIQIRGGDHVDP